MHSVVLNLLYLNFLMDSNSQVYQKHQNESANEACYSIYGEEVCFDLSSAWPNGSAPVVKAPSNPINIGTTFYHYSKTNFTAPVILDPGSLYSIINSSLNKAKSVKIIAHGYSSSSQALWFKGMIGEFLRADEEHVIAVDWSKGSYPPYAQAVANLRVVGVQLASLIYSLITYSDVDLSSFHLIGHSLGAHLVGHCGSYLKNVYGIVLPRISGLDPAGPFFRDAPPSTRLDSSDAEFVDVIHTDNSNLLGFPLSIGMVSPIGHLDFYPNGGVSQPECSGDIRCPHYRASQLFTESIRQSCPFIAVRCPSYEEFLQGDCWGCSNSSCSSMGLKAKPFADKNNDTKLFLLTNGISPFCGSHYRVTVVSSNETSSYEHGGEFAVIGIELKGARDSTGEILLSEKSIFYKSGTVFRRAILATDVGDLRSMTFAFHYRGSFLNPMSWRIRGPSLYISSVIIEQLQPQKRWKFCFLISKLLANTQHELTEQNLC